MKVIEQMTVYDLIGFIGGHDHDPLRSSWGAFGSSACRTSRGWTRQFVGFAVEWLDHVGVCLKIGYHNFTDSSSFVCSCQIIEHIVFLDWNKLIQVHLIPST